MAPEPERVGASQVTPSDTNVSSSAMRPVTLSANTSEYESSAPLNAIWLGAKVDIEGPVVSMVTLREEDAAEVKPDSVCVALSDQVPSSKAFEKVQLSAAELAVKLQVRCSSPLLAVRTT